MSNFPFLAIWSYSQLDRSMIYHVASVSSGPDIDYGARIGDRKDVTMVSRAGKAGLAPG